MSLGGAAVEKISDVVGYLDTSTTERTYRHELRPVIQDGTTLKNSFATIEVVTPPPGTWNRCSRCRETGALLRRKPLVKLPAAVPGYQGAKQEAPCPAFPLLRGPLWWAG